jgi:phosphoribosylanthranilate isomerase
MKIKVCGITTREDAVMVAEAGADAIGLNFVGGPRRIDLKQAEVILDALPPLVVPVALVSLTGPGAGEMNEQVAELLATRWISTVQVYGEVTNKAVARLAWEGYRPIVPVPVRDIAFAATRPVGVSGGGEQGAAAVLLDTHDPGRLGGTGRSFAWSLVAQARALGHLQGWPPIILAGGLTPENVAQAIREAAPYGVDVSSGVESAPGHKDPEKVRRFVDEARKVMGDG